MATGELLDRHGVEVDYPRPRPAAVNRWRTRAAAAPRVRGIERFARIFGDHEHVVCPSGSCASMVRIHYRALIGDRV
jgi:L-lactate dehydrogenase complex protein LldE